MRRRSVDPNPGDLQLLSRLAAHCDASILGGHFALGMPPPVEPSGWTRRTLGPWTVVLEPSLPVHDAVDAAGTPLGWLVGHALDLDAAAPAEMAVISRDAGDGDDLRPAVERWIDAHAGRFVLLLVAPGIVAADSLASLPLVFDRERSLVSSSPFLLQQFDEPIPDDELADVVGISETGRWFLFDTTPHARAERLLPNYMLDLRSWQQERYWPSAPFERAQEGELIERIAWTLERTIAAAAAAGDLNQSLTAGGDTRVMLACSRGVLDRIHFFTVDQPDLLGRVDSSVASRIASRFSLDHEVLAWRPSTIEDVRRFTIRTGALVSEARGSRAGPTYALLGTGRPYVSGVHERASLGWRPDDDRSVRITAIDLLHRYSTPTHPRLVDAASRWLASLPGLDAIDTLTLFGAEMRMGSWGGALTTAYPNAYTYTLYPFAHRSILDAEMRMETERRRFGAYREDLIRHTWPELLEFGLNSEPTWVRGVKKARSARDWARATAGQARRRLRQL
jgi:hypothetical protein